MAVGEDDKPPLTKGGWPADAMVRVVATKDRAAGMPDVMIYIDTDAWTDLEERQQKALLHHELHHVQLCNAKPKLNDDGEEYWTCDLDVLMRPRVKLRPHDYELGGFRVLAELYEGDSAERRNFDKAAEMLRQEAFGFARAQ